MNVNIKQYSQAIYEIAEENKKIESYLDLSLAIIDIANHNPKLFNYIGNFNVPKEDKLKLISDLCGTEKLYMNWLSVIVDSGHSKHIREFINEYIDIYNEHKGIVKGFVWTVDPIDKKIIIKFEKKFEKKLNKKIMLENKINKEIIGGIKIEIDDNVWDNTVKNKLLQILKEGQEK